ncbi:MAG: lipase family protein [Armatimonadota bacterium]|jgi:hypothetical protein
MSAPQEAGGRNCFAQFDAAAREHAPVNAYLLSLASAWVYPFIVTACTGCGAEQIPGLVRARMRHWGLGPDVRLISRSAFGRYDTQALVVAGKEIALVVFRGSEHPVRVISRTVNALRDWLATDADVRVATVSDFGREVDVHRGFLRGFMAVAEEIERAVGAPVAAGRRLWITGHSMGGALATLAAPWLRERGVPVHGVATFGAPMVGGVRFRDLIRSLAIPAFHRYVVEDDAVPRLPPEPLKYQHVGPAFLIGEDGSVVLRDEDPRGVPSLVKHPPQVYCEALSRALTDEQRRLLPPPPEP